MSVPETFSMDELDRRVVNALQIQPRAPWTLVGSVVGADPATAARRWDRLTDAGAAWISCYPPTDAATTTGFVELDCAPGRSTEVAAVLARTPHAMSVNIKAGDRDILVDLVTRDADDFGRFVLEWLGGIDGVTHVRTYPSVRPYAEASRWRLRSLDADGERRLTAPLLPTSYATERPPLTAADWEVSALLAADPRARVRDLAAALGVSPATARRRLDHVLRRQPMLRCELARTLSDWPVHATFFAACPADKIDATARRLSRLPEVRAVSSTTGPHNLFLAVWLRSLQHVQALEAEIARTMPHVHIGDRSVVIRPVKLVGRLLDANGWAVGNVPLDIRRRPDLPAGGRPGHDGRSGG